MTVQVSQGGVNPAALGGLPVLVREAAKALVTIHNFGQDWLGMAVSGCNVGVLL